MTTATDASSKSRSAAWLAAKTKNAQKKQRIVLEKELRKTKMCKYFAQGKPCYAGDNCDFAHSEEEITSRPVLSKTQLCINFAEGRCTDKNCNFAHGEDELRAMQWRYHSNDLEQNNELGTATRVPLKEAVSRLPNNWTTKQKLTAAIAKHADSPGEVSCEASANLSGESTQCGESVENSSDGASDHVASRCDLTELGDSLGPRSKNETDRRQSRLCKYYVQGYCHFGNRCHYAHSVKEMSAMPEKAQRTTQLCPFSNEATYEDFRDAKSALPQSHELLSQKKKKKKASGKKQPVSEACPRDKVIAEAMIPSALVPGPVKLEDHQTGQRAPSLHGSFEMMRLVEPMKVQQTYQAPLSQDLGNMMRRMAQLSSVIDTGASDDSLKAEVAELRVSVSALSAQVSQLGQRVPGTSGASRLPAYMMTPMRAGYEHTMDLDRSLGRMSRPSMVLPPPGLI
mmetsp:Transcript_155266/g.275376  ORF Transcript_155266/g.275376 Transcript_155266/m.275376 type:complete len:455 (-) Transcript_155266:160-1524(-)